MLLANESSNGQTGHGNSIVLILLHCIPAEVHYQTMEYINNKSASDGLFKINSSIDHAYENNFPEISDATIV